MSPEQKMIILLSKYRLDEFDISHINKTIVNEPCWDFIISQIIAHRLGGMAYYHLDNLGLIKRIPKEIRQHLRLIVSYNKVQTNRQNEYLSQLINHIDNNLSYAILKGAALQKTLYPSYTRMFNDIDILICKKDYDSFDRVLVENGFVCDIKKDVNNKKDYISLVINSHQFPCYNIMGKDDICSTVDLQYEFVETKKMNYSIDVQQVLQRTVTIGDKQEKINVLAPSDQLIHLCTHTFGDCTVVSEMLNRKAFRLFQFGDIWGLLDYYGELCIGDGLINKVVEMNVVKPIYFCLSYIDLIYGTSGQVKKIIQELRKYIIDNDILKCYGYEKKKQFYWNTSLENKLFDYYAQKELKINLETDLTINRLKEYDHRAY